jgi:hypothetical protein
MKKLFLIIAVLLIGLNSFAQEDLSPKPKEKKEDHYIGVQSNFLLRELLNLGGNNGFISNPFGLVYHLNSKKSGLGFRLGLGPGVYSTKNTDGNATITTNGYFLIGRLGIDKRIRLDDKWETGVGLDALISIENDKTLNDRSNFQNETTEVLTNSMSFGGGPMAYLRYYIRPRILFGTEASFYLLTGESKSNLKIIDENGNVSNEADDTDKFTNGSLNLPISLYLLIKF